MTLAASAQVMATHPGFLTLEYPWGLNDWRAGLVEPAERIEGSYYHLPDRPGLGAALNPEVLAARRAATCAGQPTGGSRNPCSSL